MKNPSLLHGSPRDRALRQTAIMLFAGAILSLCRAELPEPRMTYLDNDEVRIGMDLSLGGAVTFISSGEQPGNLINSADLGRQIQMSHYSGPRPFVVGDKRPHPSWAGLGWNPIQTGDCYMNPSRVVEHRNDGKEIYIRCIPMQWPLDNVPGDCVFETWTTLDGPLIHMRFRCTNQRLDKTGYPPCAQELPAVYTISRLSRLMSYTGDRPFTGDELTHVKNDWRKGWPWTRFTATERWAALVDDDGWGLGVFKDDGGEFHGGIYGDERSSDPKHGSTAYVAPIHRENFDHNIVYEHETYFMVGRLEDIRKQFNGMATKAPPVWIFTRDRQHWTLTHATDQGYPLDGAWRISSAGQKPRLESPTYCWRADTAPNIELEMEYTGRPAAIKVFWKRLDDDRWDTKKSVVIEIPGDGGIQALRLSLKESEEYHGLITGIAIEPVGEAQAGASFVIKSIRFYRPEGI